jgi:hypothetical protein
MSRSMRPTWSIRVLSVVVLGLVAWALLGSGVAGATGGKTYTADISPHSVAAGAEHTFTATLRNTAGYQRLGAANITPPDGFTLTGDASTSHGTAKVRGNVLELRHLAIPPGGTATIDFKAAVSCDAEGGKWRIVAKQGNDFSGHDFALNWAQSNLTVTVTPCEQQGVALRFVTQPTDAERGTTISSVAGDPAGAPVQVEVIDAAGNRVTSSTAVITISIGSGSPAGATLAGTTTRTAVDGVATFDDLRIDLHGDGYTLVATSPGLDPATSDAFGIWDEAVFCQAATPCTGQVAATDGLMEATVQVTSPTAGALLLSLGVDELDCQDPFNHAPQVLTVDSVNLGGTKTVTITIAKAFDQRQPNNGVKFYEICYSGEEPFIDKFGNIVPAGGEGLLPMCKTASAPCLAKRTKAHKGDVKLVVSLAPGDPKMH